jgi:hypothetical protein
LCRSFLQSYLVSVGDVTDKVQFQRRSVIFTWRTKFALYFATMLPPRLKPRPPYIWDRGKENPVHNLNIFLKLGAPYLDYSLLFVCRVRCLAQDSCNTTIKTTPKLKYKYIWWLGLESHLCWAQCNTEVYDINTANHFSHVNIVNLLFSQSQIVGRAVLLY